MDGKSESRQLFSVFACSATQLENGSVAHAMPAQQGLDVSGFCRIVLIAIEKVVVGRVGVENFGHLRIEPTASATRVICASVSARPLGI